MIADHLVDSRANLWSETLVRDLGDDAMARVIPGSRRNRQKQRGGETRKTAHHHMDSSILPHA
jgi:hypothetical protein